MTTLLEAFFSEAREFLQGIGEKLMELEDKPDDAELLNALFRIVHTLKGNSGLFEFPEMTRVLHASEDLMDAVRQGRVKFSEELADRLLESMDFVSMLCDEAEKHGGGASSKHAAESARLAKSVRQLMVGAAAVDASEPVRSPSPGDAAKRSAAEAEPLHLDCIPESVRMDAYRRATGGGALHWVEYVPAEGCFFHGEDPLFQARGTPDLLWGGITARQAWPELSALDAYRCALDYRMLSAAPRAVLDEYYVYTPDHVRVVSVRPLSFVLPEGATNGGPVYEDFVVAALSLLEAGDVAGLDGAVRAQLERFSPDLWISSALRWLLLMMEREPQNQAAFVTLIESLRRLDRPRWTAGELASSGGGATPESPSLAAESTLSLAEVEALMAVVAIQRRILSLPNEAGWQLGRIRAVSASLEGCLRANGDLAALPGLEAATVRAVAESAAAPLLAWLDSNFLASGAARVSVSGTSPSAPEEARKEPLLGAEKKVGRRSEEVGIPKSLKVDQAKIDRLMNLIGEMVVSKNALPYLAGRAETVFGVRELSREIKAQHAVMNRIAEEMQDAIMQVRMMPVSVVFQRFPRLVRDTSRKLGKDVQLVLEGEETEADKNIIEALGDPLVHIIRNSLDHGFELPEVRRAAGKPASGTLSIRARQESGRALIEITDDGKGIDPAVIKLKAYEKGIIDEDALESLTDEAAVNLVFASGFSTMDVVSELSGRGVGMDVVRAAVEKVNGTISLESEKGKGTSIRLSLPLSMAVTNVMIVESNGQRFGVPMDTVVETVRVPRASIRTIKKSQATVLRGRIVPLKSINTLLGLAVPPKASADDELAVLVVRLGTESAGILVDDFCETADIILKPMTGVLAGLAAYSGSALMGDGSVLMVLNIKEMM